VLVDALHFARSDSSLADIGAMPRHRLHYAQICDAPAEIPATTEGLIHTARCERLLPGEGGIDLAALFRTLPDDLPISVEIPTTIAHPGWAQPSGRARPSLRPKRHSRAAEPEGYFALRHVCLGL